MGNNFTITATKVLAQPYMASVRDALEELESIKMAAEGNFLAKRAWATEARDKESAAESRRAYNRGAAAELGKKVDPEISARDDAECEKTRRQARLAQHELSKASDEKRDAEQLFESNARHANSLRESVRLVETPIPRGQDNIEGIEAARASMAKHVQARRSIASAPQGIEEANAQIESELRAECADELVQVTFHNGRPKLRFELAKVNAQPANGGYIPYVPNALPHFIKANFDALLASAKVQVERYYAEHVPVSMTAKEKAKRLADVDAKILAAQRLECSIIWTLRRRGQQVAFRPDTDSRAVLGVE